MDKLRKTPIEMEEEVDKFAEEHTMYEKITTEFGDSSSIMRGCFNPSGEYYATAGASSEGTLWKIPESTSVTKLIGHGGKLQDITFHPKSGLGLSSKAPNIATASSDSDIRLWSLDASLPIQKSIPLKAHKDRVNRVLFHSCGDYLFSCSYDESWVFWDLTKGTRLYTQTGHRQPIHTMSQHPDGSLLFTGDTRGNGMIWDLRSGRSILPVQGHKDSLLCSDFSINGVTLATGGEDNYIRIWDIRKKGQIYCIPAHTKLVSDLKFSENGMVLVSASHDTTIRLWHGSLFSLIHNYKADESRQTSVSLRGSFLATTNLDRKWSLWEQRLAVKMELL